MGLTRTQVQCHTSINREMQYIFGMATELDSADGYVLSVFYLMDQALDYAITLNHQR
jgi:hypothetical protein